nr:MAG TPA: hypothetical protein [Caudoviricetes sp.]
MYFLALTRPEVKSCGLLLKRCSRFPSLRGEVKVFF